MSIEQALEELASRHKAHLVYHLETFLLEWFQSGEISQRFFFLDHTNPTKIKSILKGLQHNQNLDRIHLSYPTLRTFNRY